VTTHFNSFFGDVGIDNINAGTINATENWWKCHAGPGADGCSTVTGNGITTAPWLVRPY
jgi:hypothetical protein